MHMMDFCVVKVFMVLLETKKKFHKLTKRLWVRDDFIPNEQHCILLLETNALRIFIVLSEKKSASVIIMSQRYCLLTVWNSDLFSICFFGLDFFSGDISKTSGNMTQVSGDMTSGEMTLGRLDRKPLSSSENKAWEKFRPVVIYNLTLLGFFL